LELHARGVLSRFTTGLAMAGDSLLGRLERNAPLSWPGRGLIDEFWGAFSKAQYLSNARTRRTVAASTREGSAEAVLHARNTAFQRTIPDRWIDESTHVIGRDTLTC